MMRVEAARGIWEISRSAIPQGSPLLVSGQFISMILSGRFPNENEEDINPIPVNESTTFSKEDLDPIIRIKLMD